MRRSPLPKLARLSPGEWSDLLRAEAALGRAQLLVWTCPHGRLISKCPPSHQAAIPGAGAAGLERARALGTAVRRAATYGLVRPSCLVRALALRWMLENEGIRGARLRIGVRSHGGKLLAHAWIEYAGQVLGDRRVRTRSFQQLPAVEVITPTNSR